MGKYGHYSYDRTGWPHTCNVLYSANGGHETELAPPGAGKHLVVLGVCSTKTMESIHSQKQSNILFLQSVLVLKSKLNHSLLAYP